MNTEYGYYDGKHINLFMLKNILKDIIKPIIYKIIIFKHKNIWNVREYMIKNNKTSGIYMSFYINYFNKKNSYIGINAKFKNKPYFPHGFSNIFISDNAKIWKNAVIFQGVTIGSNTLNDTKSNGSPTLKDNVYIGAGAKIIGNITVGNNVRIGANAIVIENVDDNCVVVLEKPRIIVKKNLDNRFIKEINNEKYYYKDEKFHKL